jgi:hypothetical protein
MANNHETPKNGAEDGHNIKVREIGVRNPQIEKVAQCLAGRSGLVSTPLIGRSRTICNEPITQHWNMGE